MDPLILILAAPMALGIFLIATAGPNSRWRAARTLIGIFLVALIAGGLGYFFSGIWIARARGVGHFFSVPFGGYAVSDSAVSSSLACWVGFVFTLLSLLFRRRFKRAG
jgi:hypothetical protein